MGKETLETEKWKWRLISLPFLFASTLRDHDLTLVSRGL